MKKFELFIVLLTLFTTSCAEIDAMKYSCLQDYDCGYGYSCRSRTKNEGGGTECRPSSVKTYTTESTKNSDNLSSYDTEQNCITDNDCKLGFSCRSKSGGLNVCKPLSQKNGEITGLLKETRDIQPVPSNSNKSNQTATPAPTPGSTPSQIDEDKNKKILEAEQNKADDATCKSYGAKFGSAPYIQCRTTLSGQRNEAADRQKTIEALERKIEITQQQFQRQLSDKQKSESANALVDKERDMAYQQEQLRIQQGQLREMKLQNDQARAEARRRAFKEYMDWANNPATWGNPTNVRIVP